ncbi:MAG: hypothetical protein DRZ76_03135 [Candidatus Nealsonbacteria bacterium]|nr:MAG: hypothetical protein DRZ76_03135 [Candidatus Nealsonbacteria bacterium]
MEKVILILGAVIDESAGPTTAAAMKMEKTAIPVTITVVNVVARAVGMNTDALLLTVVEILNG